MIMIIGFYKYYNNTREDMIKLFFIMQLIERRERKAPKNKKIKDTMNAHTH